MNNETLAARALANSSRAATSVPFVTMDMASLGPTFCTPCSLETEALRIARGEPKCSSNN